MNCNYKLTKDRVERAIAEMTEKREVAVKMLEKDGMQGMLLFGWKKDLALIDTLLAALDAVRWRDMADEQPTGDDEYPVLVKLKHAVLPEVMYYVPESGCAAFWRREYHYVTDELVSTDSIWWRYVDKWLPLPKWED